MPFLVSNSARFELRLGRNVLGGRGPDAVAQTLLGDLPAAAAITIHPEGVAEIRRLDPGIVVRLNGRFVGTGGSRLHHGARLDVGSCRLVFADVSAEATTADPDVRARSAAPMTELAPVVPAEPVRARVVAVRSGLVLPVPARGLVIGRTRSCALVLDHEGVSRRHAIISPSPDGYTVRDQSANGTWLNGARVKSVARLRNGDVLRIGEEELRFETEGEATDAPPEDAVATRVVPSVADAACEAPGPLLATLEIENGELKGTTFRIVRPVSAIGRSPSSDVLVQDHSVSANHATLLLKAGTWFVVDLRSANGTFVDGYRVAGERELAPGALLRVGRVKMRFRPRTSSAVLPGGTERVEGLLDRLIRNR